MAKFLKDLLANDHPLFTANMAQLEKATDGAGIDVRLISEVAQKAHEVMRNLKLDPADTTGVELYRALNNLVKSGTAETVLADTSFILVGFEDGAVSFNLQDVIENAHHELSYSDRTTGHAKRHLRSEIIRRYAEHDRTDDTLVLEIAKQMGLTPPEDEGHPVVQPAVVASTAPTMLAIGDIFTDAFIMLSDDSARIDIDPDGTKRLSLPYGAKPSYDHVDIVKSVGPSPNAAISCARLGLKVSLMAWLGDDVPGKESLQHLASEGVDTRQMITEPGLKSSYWYVLRYKSDRTMLVKSEKYTYAWNAPAEEPEWIYLSYIGADSWPLHEQLVQYLEQHPKVKLVFQPGTFHFKWGIEKLRSIYAHAHLVVMNREEAMDVTGRGYDDLHALAEGLHQLGPKIAVITDGPNGSYASYDGRLVTIPNYPDPAPPLDRTGAGDAFASTIVAALAQGESMDTALTWAPVNSASVVQQLGAQAGLLHADELKQWLAKAPAEYVVTEVAK